MSVFHTTIILNVLSQEPIPDGMELEQIVRETIHGDYVGWQQTHEVERPDHWAKRKLLEVGSDPSFFYPEED